MDWSSLRSAIASHNLKDMRSDQPWIVQALPEDRVGKPLILISIWMAVTPCRACQLEIHVAAEILFVLQVGKNDVLPTSLHRK